MTAAVFRVRLQDSLQFGSGARRLPAPQKRFGVGATNVEVLRFLGERLLVSGGGVVGVTGLEIRESQQGKGLDVRFACRNLFQQLDRLIVGPLVGVKLGKINQCALGIRISIQSLFEDRFSLGRFVIESVQPPQGDAGIGVGGVQPDEDFKVLNSLVQ